MGNSPVLAGTKAVDQSVLDAVRKSATTPEDASLQLGPVAVDRLGILYFAAGYADAIPPWGTAPTQRDAMLQSFITKEPFAASAFGSIVMRNQAFGWELDGPEQSRNAAFDLLHRANWGAGWPDFISHFSWDLLTCDKGAFVEFVREADSPDAPIVAIKTLESYYCWSTGDPSMPVMYFDRRGGKWHRMKWYQVYHVAELPVHHPIFKGLQLSALSRALQMAKIMANALTIEEEKTGGRFTRAIHVVSGIAKQDLNDAMQLQQNAADNRLQSRYIQPVVVAAMQQDKPPAAVTLALANMPEAWDDEKEMKKYLTILAMALGTDYGEFAPLPGHGIGTGAQSETMSDKAKLKSAGLFKRLITQMLNDAVLPANVTFSYKEEDLAEEKEQADVSLARAQARGAMILNGEIDAVASRQMALEAGDISEEMFAAMGERDVIEDQTREDERQKVLAAVGQLVAPPNTAPRATMGQAGGGTQPAADSGNAAKPSGGVKELPPERLEAERKASRLIHGALGDWLGAIEEKLGVKASSVSVSAEKTVVVDKQVLRDATGRIIGVTETHREVSDRA